MGIHIPENGYLNAFGDRFDCERGYRKTPDSCEVINLPANAYLSEGGYGRGWKCERGFAQDENRCNAFTVPANAHIDYSGNGWDCDPFYERDINTCIPRRRRY